MQEIEISWWLFELPARQELNFLHIFAVPLSSGHDKCCQILERLFVVHISPLQKHSVISLKRNIGNNDMNIIFQKLLKLFHILTAKKSVQCLMGFKYAVHPFDWFLNGTLIGFIGHFLLYIHSLQRSQSVQCSFYNFRPYRAAGINRVMRTHFHHFLTETLALFQSGGQLGGHIMPTTYACLIKMFDFPAALPQCTYSLRHCSNSASVLSAVMDNLYAAYDCIKLFQSTTF